MGWQPVAFSEIEPFPSAVLAHHYPHVPNVGDMTTLPERILSRELEAPDLLVGGTPCQAFSVAGLRRGLADARGNLSLTYCEIANAIDHVRLADGREPAIIVWENVPGVLSSKDNALGHFLAGLVGESEALQAPRGKWKNAGVVVGPERLVVWRVLDAQFFGVAQRRRRIFLLSVSLRHPRAWAIAESFFPLEKGLPRNPPSRGEARKGAARGAGGVPADGSISGAVTRKWAKGSGGPAGDECYNMVAQPVAQPITFGAQMSVPQTDVDMVQTLQAKNPMAVAHALTARMYSKSSPDPGAGRGGPVVVTQPVAFTRCDNGQDAAVDVTPTMRCGSNYSAHLAVAQPVAFKVRGGVEVDSAGKAAGKGYLGSEETAFTIAATQDQWIGQPVGTDCYNGAITGEVAATIGTPGSSVNASGPTVMQPVDVKQVQWASGGGQVENDTAQALRAGAEYNYQFARVAMQVRRLTPVECERLQGFPDNYTNIPWRKKDEAPDGPRYKALGNSMAVPCMKWIGERIQAATARQEVPK